MGIWQSSESTGWTRSLKRILISQESMMRCANKKLEKKRTCCVALYVRHPSLKTQTLILYRTGSVQRVNKTVEKLQISVVVLRTYSKTNYLGINKNLPHTALLAFTSFLFLCICFCVVCVCYVPCKEGRRSIGRDDDPTQYFLKLVVISTTDILH